MKTFPKLFKKTNTGAIQLWEIWVGTDHSAYGRGDDLQVDIEGHIVIQHGQVDGKLQTTTDVIREGKNHGKKNATTAVEQAEKEAEAKWRKKQEREGYVTDLSRAEAGETDAEGGIAPMLAPSKMNEKHLTFPLDMQPKLDGVRMVAVIDNGEVSLWSRRRERMSCLPHIEEAYRQAFKGVKDRHVLDGEAYRHGWPLQKISTFTRKKNQTRPGFEEIGHFLYDVPSLNDTWKMRRLCLGAEWTLINRATGGHPIHLVPTTTVQTLQEAWAYHDERVDEGFEGAMGRNQDAPYEFGKRSQGLNKFKTFEDDEFKIVDVKEGRGKFEGKAIFVCVMDNGDTFDCTAPGTHEDKARYFTEFENYRGQMLTVKHKGWTVDRLPWHPVGKAVRDE